MASDQITQLVLGLGVTSGLHPITFAKTLIQLGYEPLPPATSRGFFGGSQAYYPNVFRYVGHIYAVDGFFGLYRGLFPRLLSAAVNSFATTAIHKKMLESGGSGRRAAAVEGADEMSGGQKCDECSTTLEQHSWKCDLNQLCRETSYEVVSHSAGIIVSYPLTVIMVRSMAQFVGRETQYNSVLGALQEILDEEGLPGFFKGIVPRLIGEVMSVCLCNVLTYIVNKYIVGDSKSLEPTKDYTSVMCSLVTSRFTYPFLLVSNVMTVNGCKLKIAQPPLSPPAYKSWLDCLFKLADNNQLKRGSAMFYRAYVGAPLVQ